MHSGWAVVGRQLRWLVGDPGGERKRACGSTARPRDAHFKDGSPGFRPAAAGAPYFAVGGLRNVGRPACPPDTATVGRPAPSMGRVSAGPAVPDRTRSTAPQVRPGALLAEKHPFFKMPPAARPFLPSSLGAGYVFEIITKFLSVCLDFFPPVRNHVGPCTHRLSKPGVKIGLLLDLDGSEGPPSRPREKFRAWTSI